MALRVPAARDPYSPEMREIRRAFKELDDPWLARSEVRVTLTTGPNEVKHGLSYAPDHWLVADKSATADIWRVSSSNRTSVTLESSANVDVILIFW